MTRRTHEQHYDHIVETAWRLFLTQGYLATTVEEIARAVGTSKRTIYASFADKEALLFAAAMRALENADCEATAIVEGDRKPEHRLEELVRWIASHARMLASGTLRDIGRGAPSVWQEIEARRRAMIRRHLAAVVQPAAAAIGALGTDEERVARVLADAVVGILASRERDGDLLETPRDIETFLGIVGRGLYGRGGAQ